MVSVRGDRGALSRARRASGPIGAAALASATALLAFACKPNLNDTVSLVTTPQVLAVQSDPAEVAPGSPSATQRSTWAPAGRS